MGLGATPIPEEQEFLDKFKIRNDIWQIREDFNESKKMWYNDVFKDQDAEKIVEQVTQDNSRLKRIKAKFPIEHEDEVLEQTLKEVYSVMEHRNLISALGNNYLKEKHWQEIFGILPDGHSGSMAQFSLQSLLEKGIEQHVERVEEVSARASGEANILNTIAEVGEQWASIDFPVESYRGQKD
jgi:dynein heavy chain